MSAPQKILRASLFQSSTQNKKKSHGFSSFASKTWQKGFTCPSSIWPPVVVAFLLIIEYKMNMPSAWRMLVITPVAIAAYSSGLRMGAILALLTTIAITIVDVHHGGTSVLAFSFLVHAFVLGGVVAGIHHTEERHRKTMVLATHDDLTGALNRHAVEAFGLMALTNALKEKEPLVIGMLDCDKFKKLNDIHGHAAGDRVLIDIVRLVKHSIGPDARIGRTGGDEFLIVWPGQSAASAEIAFLRVSNLLSDITLVQGHTATFSFGLAVLAKDGVEFRDLVQTADQDMYLRKLTKQYGPNFLETMPTPR